jgi:hypothetical protein
LKARKRWACARAARDLTANDSEMSGVTNVSIFQLYLKYRNKRSKYKKSKTQKCHKSFITMSQSNPKLYASLIKKGNWHERNTNTNV